MAELSPEKKAALAFLDQGGEYVLLFFRKAKGLDIFYPLKERGWFSPNHNPEPVETEKGLYQIPQWPALEYLKRAADEAAALKNLQYSEEIMQILRDVTRPPDGKRRDNYSTWWRFAEILSVLPTDVIKEQDIQLVADWLDTTFGNTLVTTELGKHFLPKLLAGGTPHELALAFNVINIVTRIRWTEKNGLDPEKRRDAVPITDAYWLRELLKKNSKQIGAKCGLPVFNLLSARLRTVVQENDHDRFSYIWRPAIEDHKQNDVQKLELENILLTALREATLSLLEHQAEIGRQFVEYLIDSQLQSFRRLAIYLISEKFFLLSDIFYKKLSEEWFDSRVQHELYVSLTRRFIEMLDAEKNRLVLMIENLTADWAKDDRQEEATDYLRLTWLSAIQGKGHAKANELYTQYQAKVGQAPERPEFPYYTEVGWVQHKSPYSIDELISMSAQGMVKGINEFRSLGWKEPDEEGLAASLKDAVKNNAEQFSGALEYFVPLKPRYLVAVLSAYEELCKTQQIAWKAVLNLCTLLVAPGQVWNRADEEKSDGLVPKKSWVTTEIADLIRAGLSEENHQIPSDQMSVVEQVLISLIENEPSKATGNSTDAVRETINTARGRAIECLFIYSLHCARKEHKEKGDHREFWNHIQPIYDSELNKTKDGNYEFTVLAARWLPSLSYLNKDWVKKNINRIFSITSESHWAFAIQGYGYVNAVYKEIYSLLKEHGHLRRVVDTVFEHDRIRNKYLQHIIVAYLHGDESLDDGSLFRYVLDKWNSEDIHHVVWFLWTQREEVELKVRNRILAIWIWLSNKIKGREEENKGVLADLGQLAVYLEKVGEQEKVLLMQCAPYVALKHNANFFVEYLDSLADQNPKGIAEVFIRLTERFLPDYPVEAIQSLVTKFFQAGLVQDANAICDRYRAKMHEFLINIYQRFNP